MRFRLALLGLLVVILVLVTRCIGTGAKCLGDCEELFADAGSSDVVFDGISSIDSIESDGFRVNWTKVADAAQYLVFNMSTTPPSLVARLKASTSSYRATGLVEGQSYEFRVKLLDPLGRTDKNTKNLSATTLSAAAALAALPSSSAVKMWLKSSSGITKDENSGVSEWRDQSGNGNHLSQTGAPQRPEWEDNILNGFPSLHFDGTGRFLQNGTLSYGTTPYTLFYVFSVASDLFADQAVFGGSIARSSHYGVASLLKFRHFVEGAGFPEDFGSAFLAGSFYYVTIRATGAGGSNTAAGWLNGAQEPNTVQTGSAESCTGIRLGKSPQNAVFDGSITEVLFYDVELNDTDRAGVESYLKTRYAL